MLKGHWLIPFPPAPSCLSVSVQIATLESELMQLMKQNGIQVNNNNSNSNLRHVMH